LKLTFFDKCFLFVRKKFAKNKQTDTNEEKSSKSLFLLMSRHRGKVSVVSSLTTTREEEEETTTTNTETKVQLAFDDDDELKGLAKREGELRRNRRRFHRRRRRNTTHQTSLTNSMMKTMKMMTKMMRKKTRGYLAVFLVSAIWVCASFIVKDLERVGDPLTLTALFNALFLVYWPVEMKGYFYHLAEKKKKKRRYHHYAMFRKWKESNVSTRGISSFLRENEALRCYVIVPPLFFLAQFYFNKSLQFVSVTVNTALSSVAPALTYVFGIYRGLEKPVRDSNGFLKALGLVAIGVVLTAVADDETTFGGASGMTAGGDEDSPRTRNENNSYNSYSSFVNMDTAWGVLLILASAVCYAGYATEVEIALNAVKVSDGHRDENRSRSSNQNFSRNNRVGGVLLEEREEREEEEEEDEDEDEEDEEREREAAEVNEGASEEITGRRQMKTEAKKELLAAIKDSKSRQILASVGTFAFVIVLCTMRKSILSMNKSGGMIVLKGLIDNALAEYLWCVGVAELGASVASIGLLLQIPLSAVAELLFVRADEEVWTRTTGGIFAMFCGCALIVYGFIGAMKFAGSSEEDEEDEEDDEDDDEDDEDDADDNATIARAPLL
jgi:drug/metabolite transporter (DMT)-like permease